MKETWCSQEDTHWEEVIVREKNNDGKTLSFPCGSVSQARSREREQIQMPSVSPRADDDCLSG